MLGWNEAEIMCKQTWVNVILTSCPHALDFMAKHIFTLHALMHSNYEYFHTIRKGNAAKCQIEHETGRNNEDRAVFDLNYKYSLAIRFVCVIYYHFFQKD